MLIKRSIALLLSGALCLLDIGRPQSVVQKQIVSYTNQAMMLPLLSQPWIARGLSDGLGLALSFGRPALLDQPALITNSGVPQWVPVAIFLGGLASAATVSWVLVWGLCKILGVPFPRGKNDAVPTKIRPSLAKYVASFALIAVVFSFPYVLEYYWTNHSKAPIQNQAKVETKTDLKAQRLELLRQAGFVSIGQNYYVKNNHWVLLAQDDGTVAHLFTPMMSVKKNSQWIGVTAVKDGNESAVRLIAPDRTYADRFLTNDDEITGDPVRGPLFTNAEQRSGHPLETRLKAIGARETQPGSSVFFLTNGFRFLVFIVSEQKIVFVGTERLGLGFEPGSWVTGEAVLNVQNFFSNQKKAQPILSLEDQKFKYQLDLSGFRIADSMMIKEHAVPRTEDQTFSKKDPSGFWIGGPNSNRTIDRMNSLTGVSIGEIEDRAKPGSYSVVGFLGKDESFKSRLKWDNNFVTGRQLTHTQIAEPLFYTMNIMEEAEVRHLTFVYKGDTYEASFQQWDGAQRSIFQDGLNATRDYTVKNLRTGKAVTFSQMLPDYIHRYGFYEGSPYRVEPQTIIGVFNLRSTVQPFWRFFGFLVSPNLIFRFVPHAPLAAA